MRAALLALLVLSGLAARAAAQPGDAPERGAAQAGAAPARAGPSCLIADGTSLDARTLFRRTYGQPKNEPAPASLSPEERLAEETRLREAIAQAEARWTDARAAAELTLEPVYGARFDPPALRAARP
ncbi:hypothetical protein [Roseomonas rosulenta]|uniref:hypothetical protein n=1 Tax=Roseomonas rosulenta TaxID=2748667 RepID=UPI0018DF1C46|nr:hypothetical protein [Roseomonas rosulenta]